MNKKILLSFSAAFFIAAAIIMHVAGGPVATQPVFSETVNNTVATAHSSGNSILYWLSSGLAFASGLVFGYVRYFYNEDQ